MYTENQSAKRKYVYVWDGWGLEVGLINIVSTNRIGFVQEDCGSGGGGGTRNILHDEFDRNCRLLNQGIVYMFHDEENCQLLIKKKKKIFLVF